MKILYLAGLAHTGSTYLSKVLNQHSDIFSAGEMTNFGEEYETENPTNISCACLRLKPDGAQCNFWPEVFDQIDRSSYNPKNISRLSHDRRLEWIKACFNSYPPGGKETFRDGNNFLYQTLSDKTNSNIILDSSKTIWRLLPLSRVTRSPLKILHLHKEPWNQMQSRLRRGYNFWHSALLKYFRKNGLIKYWFSGNENYYSLSFEKFVREPTETLQELYDWLDVPYQDPFDQPQRETHHLRGHLDAYLKSGDSESIDRPDPERLNRQTESLSYPQQLCISFLRKLFRNSGSNE